MQIFSHLYPPLGNLTTHTAILPVLLTTSHIAFLAQAYSALLSCLCYRASKRLGYFLSSSSLQIIWRVFICVHCYTCLHSGKNANLFPCILGNFEKNETNFTILREHLCMLHYSSMPATIEHSPIEKNKKANMYVLYVLTICIQLKDKKSLFINVHFCSFFNPYMDVIFNQVCSTCIQKTISTVMMLCEQYNIRGVKSYLNEDYLAFMQMLLHIFFISL